MSTSEKGGGLFSGGYGISFSEGNKSRLMQLAKSVKFCVKMTGSSSKKNLYVLYRTSLFIALQINVIYLKIDL